jgi:hypothetical protein
MLEDLQLLMEFSTARGLLGEGDKSIETVSELLNKPLKSWSAAEEKLLWVSRDELARTVAPATVDRIRAEFAPENKSGRMATMRIVRLMRLVFLPIALSLSVYAVIGQQLIDGTSDVFAKLQAAQAALDGGAARGGGSPGGAPQVGAPKTSNPGQGSLVTSLLVPICQELNTYSQSLISWNNFWRIPATVLSDVTLSPLIRTAKETDCSELPRADPEIAMASILSGSKEIPGSAGVASRESILARSAEVVLLVYLLPLFFGALGSSVALLRAVEKAFVEYSRNPTDRWSLGTQLSVGAVMGFAIVAIIFSTPLSHPGPGLAPAGQAAVNAGFVASLSTIAVAFLAGYNTEALLSSIDAASRFVFGRIFGSGGDAKE